MTTREIRKQGYKKIFKQGKSHQEVYEEIRTASQESPEEIAEILAAIPSQAKNNSVKPYWMIYCSLLGLVMILRLMAVGLLWVSGIREPWILLLAVALGVVVPVAGIISAFQGKVQGYGGIAGLMFLNIVRMFTQGEIGSHFTSYIVLGLFVAIIIFAAIIPRKLKIGFSKTVEKKEVDGKIKNRLVIQFENFNDEAPELLDSEV
jgi:hypothetical protein